MRKLLYIVLTVYTFSCTTPSKKETPSDQDSVSVSLTIDYDGIIATQNFEGLVVKNGTNVSDILNLFTKSPGNLVYSDTLYSQMGKFVTGFSGIKSQDSKYWTYCINGKMANAGIEEMKVVRDSNIKWILTKDSNPCD